MQEKELDSSVGPFMLGEEDHPEVQEQWESKSVMQCMHNSSSISPVFWIPCT